MNLSISNIAWDVVNDPCVAETLGEYAITEIDVAPSKYFSDPPAATSREIHAVRDGWRHRGIRISGMQALLFGTRGFNIFAEQKSRDNMLVYLSHICRIGSALGARNLVFGSPKNRDCAAIEAKKADAMAVAFFGQLGDRAAEHDVVICLEPNPRIYGSNFMINSADTANIVRAVDHPAIRMQFDTGASMINKENVELVLKDYRDIIAHVHISEPNLAPLPLPSSPHLRISRSLARWAPSLTRCIEMVAAVDEPQVDAVRRAVDYAARTYRLAVAAQQTDLPCASGVGNA